MAELVQDNWIFLVLALVLGMLVAWWVFVASRRTRVSIVRDDDTPAKRNQALIDAPPAAKPEGIASVAPVAVGGDDLTRIKGVGPKLVEQLAALGVTRYDEIAAWDDAEIERIDAQLGRFQGRIRRDDWPAQARLLAAGDEAGYEAKFGRL